MSRSQRIDANRRTQCDGRQCTASMKLYRRKLKFVTLYRLSIKRQHRLRSEKYRYCSLMEEETRQLVSSHLLRLISMFVCFRHKASNVSAFRLSNVRHSLSPQYREICIQNKTRLDMIAFHVSAKAITIHDFDALSLKLCD